MSNPIDDYFDFEQHESLLSFAWGNTDNTEKELFTSNRLKKAQNIAQETDILVIIGYSFPYFNREVDKEIFKSILQRNSLQKIYCQDPSAMEVFCKISSGFQTISKSNILKMLKVISSHQNSE
jgi:hypothetical protein